jgi:hypothetical protein
MARKLAIDETAVAQAVLVTLLSEEELEAPLEALDLVSVAEHVLAAAEVEYKPTARKLVLTFDLSGDAKPPAAVNAEYRVEDDPTHQD